MKMLKFFVASILVFSSLNVIAQTDDDDERTYTGNQFYAEFGGPGVVFSANFDSRFKKGTDLGFGYRIGLGFGISDSYDAYRYSYDAYEYDGVHYEGGYYYTHHAKTRSYLTIPFGINYVFGKKSSPHAFEVGVGATILTRKVDLYNYEDNFEGGYLIGHTSFMYRKKPIDGGFTWRIGITPIVGTAGDISPSMAVGIGYAF